MDGNHDVIVPRWAVEFILENASLQDEGPAGEGWWSEEMIKAREAIENALKTDADMVSRLNDSERDSDGNRDSPRLLDDGELDVRQREVEHQLHGHILAVGDVGVPPSGKKMR